MKYVWIFCTATMVGLFTMITVLALAGMRRDVEMAKLGYVQEQSRGTCGVLWVKPVKGDQNADHD